MPWTLTITGVPELIDTLQRLPDAVAGEILLAALTDAGIPMRDRMRELAPRGPRAPHMADSITIVPSKSDAVSAEVLLGPTKEFFYARFWEFGWKYHDAKPFMRPGYDEMADAVVERLGRELWERISAAGSREVSGP